MSTDINGDSITPGGSHAVLNTARPLPKTAQDNAVHAVIVLSAMVSRS
ncbi:Uncharacterised protein [Mycolicibacterium phlei]|nr:Uncharacterised protein [Mycolicibacterium phlei]